MTKLAWRMASAVWRAALPLVGSCFLMSTAAAAQTALSVQGYTLYELDLVTGEYSARGPVAVSGFDQVTLHDGVLFGTTPTQGASVHAIDSQTRDLRWSATLAGLSSPRGIALVDSFLYVAAIKYSGGHATHYLARLDPGSGDEISRVALQLPPLLFPLALTSWRQELSVLTFGSPWVTAYAADPDTGSLGASTELVGVQIIDGAVVDPEDDLWLTEWRPDAIGDSWCTHYYELVGANTAVIERLVRCWAYPAPGTPTFIEIAVIDGGVPSPVAIPTIDVRAACVLILVLAVAGLRAVRSDA